MLGGVTCKRFLYHLVVAMYNAWQVRCHGDRLYLSTNFCKSLVLCNEHYIQERGKPDWKEIAGKSLAVKGKFWHTVKDGEGSYWILVSSNCVTTQSTLYVIVKEYNLESFVVKTCSGGWGYGPRFGELAEKIRANVPSAEVTGQVGRRSNDQSFFKFNFINVSLTLLYLSWF